MMLVTGCVQELSALLPTVLLHIHLIGPHISSLVDGQVSTPRSTVTVTCHRGLYHAVHSCLPVPDVVIGKSLAPLLLLCTVTTSECGSNAFGHICLSACLFACLPIWALSFET